MKPTPRLICIPSADREFAEEANELLAALAQDRPGDDDLRDRLERALRRRHPGAVVRPRHPLAAVGVEVDRVWYVLRPAFRSRLHAAVEIAAPRDLVFDLYVRPERIPEWQTAVRVTPAPHAGLVGSEYLARYTVLGVPVQGRFRVVDAERPSYFRVEASGTGIRLWYATSFTATPSGTRLVVDGDYDVPPNALAQVVDQLFLERAVQRDVETAHANLKALCEALARSAAAEDAPSAVRAG